jgi:hypothetical protein
LGRPHEKENKVRLALGTAPAWELNDGILMRSPKHHRACSAYRKPPKF